MNGSPLYLRIADLTVAVRGWDYPFKALEPFRLPEGEGSTPDAVVEFTPSVTEGPWLRLHRLLTEALVEKDVLLFHASAVSVDGEAYAFTAPSGTGKSTHAALWKTLFGDRCQYVNDDKPFLVFRNDEVFIAGSPWMGKHSRGRNVMLPLRGIAFLSQAGENRIESVDPMEGYTKMMQQVFLPENRESMERTLSLLEKAAVRVPFYHLNCLPEESAARLAADVMRRGA